VKTQATEAAGKTMDSPVKAASMIRKAAPSMSNLALQTMLRSGAVRAKLEIGQLDDPLERQADEAADRVMRALDHTVPCCDSCTDEPVVRRAPERSGSHGDAWTKFDRADLGLGGGAALPSALRNFFEPCFGRDFGGVRVHTDSSAAAGARSIGARAYAIGNDIAFAAGEYRPGTETGLELIAHELAHVADVARGDERRIRRKPPADAAPALVAGSTFASAFAATARDIAAEKSDPKPGRHTLALFNNRFETIATLSDDAAHTRRMLALAIGRHGLTELDTAIALQEQDAGRAWSSDNQQAVIPLARREYERLAKDWTDFSARVRTIAAMRLEYNHQALGQWEDYVANMPPQRVRADMTASNNLNFVQRVVNMPYVGPHDMGTMAETWATTTSPGMRVYAEKLAGDEIHGGCQDCHTQKDVPDFDRRIAMWDQSRIPLFQRSRDIALADFQRGGWIEPTVMGATIPGEKASVDMRAVAQDRPGLTSILDSADITSPQFRTLQSAITGRAAEEPRVAGSLGDIVRLLYISNVIVEGSIDAGLTGERLKRSVLAAIASRREQIAALRAKVLKPDYDFLLLEEIVQAVLGGVDADVRLMIKGAHQTRIEEAHDRGILEMILGIAALIMLVTPLAPLGLAIGVGLSISQLQQGIVSLRQGLDILSGTNANVFTREQEMAAGEMVASGFISVALSVTDLATTGYSVFNAMRAAGAGERTGQALVRGEAAAEAGTGSAGAIKPDAVYGRPTFDEATGTMRVSATRLTAQGAGETVEVTVNMRTGLGEAVVTTPQGSYTVRFSKDGVTEVVSPAGVATPGPAASARAGAAGASERALITAPGPYLPGQTPALPGPVFPPMIEGRPQLALPMGEGDFTGLNREVFGADVGAPPTWRVAPDGTIVAESPFRPGLPSYWKDANAPDMLFDQSQMLHGPLPDKLSPFDYFLPESTAGMSTHTLNQARQTPRAANRWVASHLRGDRGRIFITERAGPLADDAFMSLDVPNWPHAREPDIHQPMLGDNMYEGGILKSVPGQNMLALESKNFRYFHNPGGGLPTELHYVPLSSRIRDEITADGLLMHQANSTYRPLWVFVDAPPSAALVQELDFAQIPYIYWGDRLPQ